MSEISKTVISFYERNAQKFDVERNRTLFEKRWLDKFLSSVPNRGSILDLGCGCGQPIAEYIIDKGYHLTGVDSSPKMIEMCRGRFPKQKWIIGDMREVKFNEKFDGVLAWDSFFHLTHDDQKSMFPIFRTYIKPLAPLMFTAGPEHGEVINPLWDAPLYHASFSKSEYYDLLKKNGFDSISHKFEDQECESRSIYLAKRRSSK